MKKLFTLAFWACICSYVSGQQILLFSENFDNGPSAFVINAPGVGSNQGANQWIINNNFNGVPLYPDTKPQDSVVSGQIDPGNAAHSNYLHIHDLAAATSTGDSVDDACWNPAVGSDRFCYIGSPFCTLGLTDVIFTFFWLCEGDANAYGQVYYRANGGPWTQTGQAKYNGQSIWKYDTIGNPAFNNVQNLQFGFRWFNQSSGPFDESFAIDDVIAIGTYDAVNHPVKIHVNQIIPDSVCGGNNLTIGFSLSAPLCDGTYNIFMSDGNGNFDYSTDLSIFNFSAPDTTGFISVPVPNNDTGNCFRITITRVLPEPVIMSDTSVCFKIYPCPVSIITDGAPVMNDIDTTCVKSALDVHFNSFGNLNLDNIYYGEFSDSNGSFAHPDTFGQLPSSQSYPGPPGTVSGMVPANLPPGCGYYIRIVSSDPPTIGTTIGPFCVKQCDVTTNRTQDIQMCINYPNAIDTVVLNIKTNSWTNTDTYDTCNNWTVELLSMMNFSIVNIGGLGVYHDSTSGNFLLIAGPLSSLPVAPGSYYMRIISNCPGTQWDSTGTVIRLTIGAPTTTPLTITGNSIDSVACNTPGSFLVLSVNPYNPNSQYYWSSNLLNGGTPFTIPGNTLDFYLSGAQPGQYQFYVQENNFGCYGPYSAPYTYYITTYPKVHITGPHQLCPGDTAIYKVGFLHDTYYDWSAPPGVQILVQGNNEVTMVFDSTGTFTIGDISINRCGTASGTYTIKVESPLTLSTGSGQVICQGQGDTITALGGNINKVFNSQDSGQQGMQGGMFNIIAHDGVTIDSFAVFFLQQQAVNGFIYVKRGSYIPYEQNQSAWTNLVSYTNLTAAPVGQLTVIPYELNMPVAAGDTAAFYITTDASAPIVNEAYGAGTGIQQGTVYKSDGIIEFAQGTANNYPFGTFIGPRILNVNIYYTTRAGLKYKWSTGDTTAAIAVAPLQSTWYSVAVKDSSGCKANDSVFVTVNPIPTVNAGPDTVICQGVNYVMTSSASVATVYWSPAAGLNETDSVNPVFNSDSSQVYVLTAVATNGCKRSDTVDIKVITFFVNPGADDTICFSELDTLNASASAQNIVWSPPPGANLSDTTVLNPVFSAAQAGKYLLVLTVHDSGCVMSKQITITVDECKTFISVAQAFTPNGDGLNDFFTVFGEYIATYQIRIFNRWGEEVYASNDVSELNNLNRGWDGNYKGKKQNSATFVYYISAKDINGKNIFKKGNLELIR